MADDQGGIRWRLAGQAGQVRDQVTAVHDGRVPAGGGDGGRQLRGPVPFPRPDQAGQPAGIIVAGHVERVQVEPGAPGDHRDPGWQRDRPRGWQCSVGACRVQACHLVPVVVVGVAVIQQGEAGAGADIDQRERLGQPGQRGQQNGAAGLVDWSGSAGPAAPRRAGRGTGGSGSVAGHGPAAAEQVACPGEQQPGLAAAGRQPRDEVHDDVVGGSRLRQGLIRRRAAPRLPAGKRPNAAAAAATGSLSGCPTGGRLSRLRHGSPACCAAAAARTLRA